MIDLAELRRQLERAENGVVHLDRNYAKKLLEEIERLRKPDVYRYDA